MPWLEKFSSSLCHKPQFILYSSQYYKLFTHVSCGGNCWGVNLLNSCRSLNVFPCLFAASDYESEWMAELWVRAGAHAPREWEYEGSPGNGCEGMKGSVSLQVSPGAGEWLQVREGWMQAGGGRVVWKREVGKKGSQIPEGTRGWGKRSSWDTRRWRRPGGAPALQLKWYPLWPQHNSDPKK